MCNEHVRLLFAKYLRKECSPQEFEEMLTWLVAMDEEEKNKLSAPLKELWDQAMAEKLPSTAEQVDWDRVFNRVVNSGNQLRQSPIVFQKAQESAGKSGCCGNHFRSHYFRQHFIILTRKTPTELVKTGKTGPAFT